MIKNIHTLALGIVLALSTAACQGPKTRRAEFVGMPAKKQPAATSTAATSSKSTSGSSQSGIASWYTDTRTASGERFSSKAMAAAHKTLPLGSRVRVVNKRNGRSVVVRINDRGPYIKGRVIDLTYVAARELGMIGSGIVPVEVTRLN